MKTHNNPALGSTLDSFLESENLLEHTQAVALKRVIAYQLLDVLAKQKLTQTDLARKMHTSKAAVSRLLDPNNASITLRTLLKAAHVLGKNLNITVD